MTYDNMCGSISMDFVGNVDRATPIFGSSNFALLGWSKLPVDIRKLRVLLELKC